MKKYSGSRAVRDSATVMLEDEALNCGTAFESDLELNNLTIEEARTTVWEEGRWERLTEALGRLLVPPQESEA